MGADGDILLLYLPVWVHRFVLHFIVPARELVWQWEMNCMNQEGYFIRKNLQTNGFQTNLHVAFFSGKNSIAEITWNPGKLEAYTASIGHVL